MKELKHIRATQEAHDLLKAITNNTNEKKWVALERILRTELDRVQNKPT
jgi:hypothetical protein